MRSRHQYYDECKALGAKWLPGYNIVVQEMDYGNAMGVAVETPSKRRQGVRGSQKDRWIYPPWYLFWRSPIFVPALTPRLAIAKLTEWVIRTECDLPEDWENEEPLDG